MIVTFPHLGNVYITVKAMLDTLGVEYVVPPFNNKEALEIGSKYAPDTACLPLKINIGNFLQAKRMGADTIIITGGKGPCRFGYYGEMHQRLLDDIGAGMEVITLDSPKEGRKNLLGRIKKMTGGFEPFKLLRAINNAKNTCIMVDKIEDLSFKTRARELHKGDTDEAYKEFQQRALKVHGYSEIKALCQKTDQKLRDIPQNTNNRPLRVGILGEIYTTIEPFANANIAVHLGHMGIEVTRPITLTSWVLDHMLKKALHLPVDKRFAEEAKPYLGKMIGGHAQETVGNAVMMAKDGYDGIVQVYPLTCMPEIVAQGILKKVSRDYDIPVMTMIIDELTGEEGYITRIEAFADLLRRRSELAVTNEASKKLQENIK